MSDEGYRVYGMRWVILLAVFLVNGGCYMLNVSLASVSTSAAVYYNVTGEYIDVISVSQNIVSIPGIWISIFLIEKLEMLRSFRLATCASMLGCIVRAASTLPPYEHAISGVSKFYLTLAGQLIISIGFPICTIMTTKISQIWFSEKERPLSTGILSMSQMIGALFGQGLSPVIINDNPENVPYLNILLPVPILLAFLIGFCGLKKNAPETAPSRSAELLRRSDHKISLLEALKSVKRVLFNRTAFIIGLSQGASIGGTLLLMTQLNQYLCASNYSTQESSLSIVAGIISGIFGAFILGSVVKYFNIQVIFFKAAYALNVVLFAFVLYVIRIPDIFYVILVLMGLIFFIGCANYAVALELAAEETYPIDPIIGESLIHMVGQIAGILYIFLGNAIYWDLPEGTLQTCSQDGSGILAKDYTPFFFIMIGQYILLTIILIFFANPKLNRQKEDRLLTNIEYSEDQT